jgi:hypothetical protein
VPNLITEWYKSKKKTHHRVWETDEGKYAWCLFFTDGWTGTFHSGSEISRAKAEDQILWSIGTELRKRELI